MRRLSTNGLLTTALLLTAAGCYSDNTNYTYQTYPAPALRTPPPPPPAASQPAATLPEPAAPQPADLPPQPAQEQPEVLTRGPVHEAFAQPLTTQSQPGSTIDTPPPATITETPPAERPTETACSWVPGYWSWDAERNSYIWVSGCWRQAPPRMNWVPGYWSQVPAGWQWVPGYWAPTAPQDAVYLPPPPAVADIQPPGVPPSPDEFWVPGCWYWYQGHYVSRSGYWLHQQPGWIWAPSYCTWTPRGYIFVEGHWDFALERRGVLFAPVCFPARAATSVSIAFSPGITMNVSVLSTSMFACPREAHYYFGDYYDDTYLRVGIYPWFDCVRIGSWHDPLFIYARWDHHRTDPRWEEHARQEFVQRHDNRNLRPPRTYREQETHLARLPASQRNSQQLARPASTLIATPTAPGRMQRADAATHQNDVQQSQAAHNVRDERSHRESAPPATQAPSAQAPSHTSEHNTTRNTAPTAPARNSATSTEPSTTPRANPPVTHSNQAPAPSTPRTTTPPATTAGSTQPATDASPRSRSHEFPSRTTPTAPSHDTAPAPAQPDHTQTTSPTSTEPSPTPRTSDHTFHSNMSPVPSVTRTTPTATSPDPTPRPSAPAMDANTITRSSDQTYRGVSVAPTHETQPTTATPDRSRATSVVTTDPNAPIRSTDRTTRSYPTTVTPPPTRTTTPVAVPPTTPIDRTPGQNTTSGDAGTTRGMGDPASSGEYRRDRSRDDR